VLQRCDLPHRYCAAKGLAQVGSQSPLLPSKVPSSFSAAEGVTSWWREGATFSWRRTTSQSGAFGQRIVSPAIPAIGVAANGKAMGKATDKVRAALGGP